MLLKDLMLEANRREEIKAITMQALDLAIEKYDEYFEGDTAEKARAAFSKVNRELTKRDMTDILSDVGITPASEVAQFIISQSFKLDNDATKAKMAA